MLTLAYLYIRSQNIQIMMPGYLYRACCCEYTGWNALWLQILIFNEIKKWIFRTEHNFYIDNEFDIPLGVMRK